MSVKISGIKKIIPFFVICIIFFSCIKEKPVEKKENPETSVIFTAPEKSEFYLLIENSMKNAFLPLIIQEGIFDALNYNNFKNILESILQDDIYLWLLVDKENPLPENYEPFDLVELKNASYMVNRNDMFLRDTAAVSLEEMAAAANAYGITLLASSAYRSYDYQTQVYNRNVAQMGQEAADRESARPGHSQHQLGLVIDFGSITDAFAETAQGVWLAANASRFGWSLSYPEGYEETTGYRWESWHYRYTGIKLAEFIDVYFDGIQQYALRFLQEYDKEKQRINNNE